MKAVLIAIQPYWVFLIIAKTMGWEIDQEKTVEVRKHFPKDLDWNRKSIIYCSKNKQSFNRIPKKYQPLMEKFLGKVIGEFVCDRIDYIGKRGINNNFDYCYLSLNKFGNDDIEIEITDIKKSCISKDELNAYGDNSSCLYAWHITDLVIYDKLRELGEFTLARHCFNTKNLETVKNCMGDYVTKYYNNSFCRQCKYYDSDCNWCDKTDTERPVTRPPQSWCYVEGV